MELNDVIKALSVIDDKQPLPREALAEAVRLKDTITPVLSSAIDLVCEKLSRSDDTVCDDSEYNISFYALFLLAQFQEQNIFPKLLEILRLDSDGLDMMMGDAIGNLGSILYSTYNGDLAAVKAVITDDSLMPSARYAALQLLDALMRDGRLSREDFVHFLRERLAALGDSDDESFWGGFIISIIANSDLYELVEDVREAFCLEKIDLMHMGAFDSFFDYLYNEEKFPEHARIITDAAQELEGWSCFKSDASSGPSMDDILNWKVGRNDPCPCGSGKKFKKCCLPKKEKLLLDNDNWEIPWDTYPPVQRQGARPGLADFYDKDAIAVDRLAYQGMHWYRYRPPFWKRWSQYEQRQTEAQAQNLLWDAFELFQRICARNGFESPEAYDRGYKLHYYCKQWLEALQELLKDRGDERYREVESVLSRKEQ